jgi:hypothetical protein
MKGKNLFTAVGIARLVTFNFNNKVSTDAYEIMGQLQAPGQLYPCNLHIYWTGGWKRLQRRRGGWMSVPAENLTHLYDGLALTWCLGET